MYYLFNLILNHEARYVTKGCYASLLSLLRSNDSEVTAATAELFPMPPPPDGKEKTRLLQYHRPRNSETTNYIKEETRK